MTNDGQFVYVWDNADRLKEVRTLDNSLLMSCRYDGLGRRRERIVAARGVGGPSTNRYVYHEWAVLEVRDGANTVLETYTHGPDLSGTLGGAGGIGGILSCTTSASATAYYHYDGNGNVVRLTDASRSIVSALEYGPFGTVLLKSGPYTPRYQFSSKEYDTATGLNYYGFRFYSPQLGRWLSRDPTEEAGGLNLYGFVKNNPANRIDPLGLSPLDVRVKRIEDYLAIGATGMAADESYLLYLNLSMGGGLASPFAAEMMDHWLGNTGTKKTLPPSRVESLVKDPEVSKQFYAFIKGVTPVANGKHCTTVTPKINTGNYYALGTFTLCVSCCPQKSASSVTLDGLWEVEDKYDWHAGLYVTVLGTVIKDDYALLVEGIGKAKSYDVDGSWKGKHTVP